MIHILMGGYYIVDYDVDGVRDVLDELVQSGYYARIPAAIKRCIDFDKLIADLEEVG